MIYKSFVFFPSGGHVLHIPARSRSQLAAFALQVSLVATLSGCGLPKATDEHPQLEQPKFAIQLLPGPIVEGQPAVPVRVEVWAALEGTAPGDAKYCVKLTGDPGRFDLPFEEDRAPETVPHQASTVVSVERPAESASHLAKGFAVARYVPKARHEVATLFAALFQADCMGAELASTAFVLSLKPPDTDGDGGPDEDAGLESTGTH